MNTPLIAGEVWVDGKRTGAKPLPFFSQHGISVQNQAGGSAGPHASIALSSAHFIALLIRDGDGALELTGADLGSIDALMGYAAADLGTHSRPITACELRIRRRESDIRFEFRGTADKVDPATIREGARLDRFGDGPIEFLIWFALTPEQCAACCNDGDIREALVQTTTRSGNYNRQPDESIDSTG